MADSPVSRRAFVRAVPAGVAASAPAGLAAQVLAGTPPQASLPRPAGPVKILGMTDFNEQELSKIQNAAPGVAVQYMQVKTREEFRKLLPEAEVVFGGMRGPDLDFAPRLKWVQSGGAGVEGLDEAFKKSPVVLTNFARTFAPGISETAIGLLLCLTRGITTYYMPQFYKRQMKPVGTVKSADHIELAGRTMGIVGMGGIGAAIARRAHYGFDMRIVATDARAMHPPEYVAELHDPSYFETMAQQVDVLVSAAPHTPKTDRMFNEKIFRSMKRTAYFLNMSRGRLMDDMALVKALKEKWIAGAGLDVMPVEPPPSDHPIFDLPNVVMTAHTSGWSPDRQIRLVELFAENVRRYALGLPLINIVDKVAGY